MKPEFIKTIISPWNIRTEEELYRASTIAMHMGAWRGQAASLTYTTEPERVDSENAIKAGTTQFTESSFKYTMNRFGLRETFETVDQLQDPDTIYIAALGCSCTFGIGLPNDMIWPRLVEQTLRSEGIPAQIVNLGTPGGSVIKAVRMLAMWRNFINFKAVAMLLPQPSRTEVPYTNSTRHPPALLMADFLPNFSGKAPLKPQYDLYYKFMTDEWLVYEVQRNLSHLMGLCANLPLVGSSWDWDTFFIMQDYSDVIGLAPYFQMYYNEDAKNCRLARDGYHPGPTSQERYAEQVSLRMIQQLKGTK